MTAPERLEPAPPEVDPDRHFSLLGLLEERAARDPRGIGFRVGVTASASDAHSDLSWLDALGAVHRLAVHFAALGLPGGAGLGIRLTNRPEACLSIIAAQAAGLLPCLLDIGHEAGDLSAAIAAADIRAVVTRTVFGPDRPADALAFVAAGFPRLRILMAFGPEAPRGVIALDGILTDPASAPESAELPPPVGEMVTFTRVGTRLVPVRRSHAALMAAAEEFRAASCIGPGERLVTFLPPDDLKGLACGLAASLQADAMLEMHEVFQAEALIASIDRGSDAHLAVPGAIEAQLAGSGIDDRVRSTILLHQPPFTLGLERCGGRVVDVLALGEQALLCGARTGPDRLSMLRRSSESDSAASSMVDESGKVWLRGPSVVDVAGVQSTRLEVWLPSPYRLGSLRDRILVEDEDGHEPSSPRGVVAMRRDRVDAGHERSPEGTGRR